MIATGEENYESQLRLMLVDDQAVILRGLSMILGAEAGIEIVGQATNGHEAIEMAESLSPDIVVMDIKMPNVSGVVATREIHARHPDIGIIILTTYDTDDLVFEAIRAGAQAYLLKDASEEELLETVRAVHRGESHLSPTIAQKVIREFRQMSATGPSASERPVSSENIEPVGEQPVYGTLTTKEENILSLIAKGKSNKQIAATVFLAEGTIKNYVSRIMDKLHANSRTELAIRAHNRQS